MHLIISKWLRIQNSDKRERQSDKEVEAKEDNLSESVFFSFNYAADHASIRFFSCVNSLHCFVCFNLYYLLFFLSSDRFAPLTSL